MKGTGFLQADFLPGLSFNQEAFPENEWLWGATILLIFFVLLLVLYQASRVFHRFQWKRKTAARPGENHPAIPAVFYDTPLVPDASDPPELELAETEEVSDDREDPDIRGDPEEYSFFSQLDKIS